MPKLHCVLAGLLVLFELCYTQWWEEKVNNWTKINQTTRNGMAMACANYNHSLYFIGGWYPDTLSELNGIQKWDISNLTSQSILTQNITLPITNINSTVAFYNPNSITRIDHILYAVEQSTIRRFDLNTQTRMSDLSLPYSFGGIKKCMFNVLKIKIVLKIF